MSSPLTPDRSIRGGFGSACRARTLEGYLLARPNRLMRRRARSAEIDFSAHVACRIASRRIRAAAFDPLAVTPVSQTSTEPTRNGASSSAPSHAKQRTGTFSSTTLSKKRMSQAGVSAVRRNRRVLKPKTALMATKGVTHASLLRDEPDHIYQEDEPKHIAFRSKVPFLLALWVRANFLQLSDRFPKASLKSCLPGP